MAVAAQLVRRVMVRATSGDLAGSFIPLTGTQAQHVANGDPRLSLHERYSSDTRYVAAVTTAANNLVSEGFLLPDDADEHHQ